MAYRAGSSHDFAADQLKEFGTLLDLVSDVLLVLEVPVDLRSPLCVVLGRRLLRFVDDSVAVVALLLLQPGLFQLLGLHLLVLCALDLKFLGFALGNSVFRGSVEVFRFEVRWADRLGLRRYELITNLLGDLFLLCPVVKGLVHWPGEELRDKVVLLLLRLQRPHALLVLAFLPPVNLSCLDQLLAFFISFSLLPVFSLPY